MYAAKFFCASSTDVLLRLKLACSHLFGQENICPSRQKNIIHRYWLKKNDSRRLPGKMNDQGLKKKHHRMMPIEHFLTDIMQISFTDWIENSIADIGREIAATNIFQPTLRNFFLETLAGRQCFFLRQRKFSNPCEKLWTFELVESFRCSISSVSIYYVPESNIRVKCYDHSNFSRASVVQFRASRWDMSPNRTSVWKLMTIRNSREFPLFNFERLDILCPRIGHPCENLWPFEFLESFRWSISSIQMS